MFHILIRVGPRSYDHIARRAVADILATQRNNLIHLSYVIFRPYSDSYLCFCAFRLGKLDLSAFDALYASLVNLLVKGKLKTLE